MLSCGAWQLYFHHRHYHQHHRLWNQSLLQLQLPWHASSSQNYQICYHYHQLFSPWPRVKIHFCAVWQHPCYHHQLVLTLLLLTTTSCQMSRLSTVFRFVICRLSRASACCLYVSVFVHIACHFMFLYFFSEFISWTFRYDRTSP